MSKKSISIIAAIVLCFLFCGYPLSTTAYGAEDKVTEKIDSLQAITCTYPDASKLPDVVVTYKDGVCTVKNIPALQHPRYGRTEHYEYEKMGNAGIFIASIYSEYSPIEAEQLPSYYVRIVSCSGFEV